MNVNIPPPPPMVAKPYNTTVNAEAFHPAAAAALQSAGVTQTQTLQAPSAINRGEAPRRTANGTQTGQSVDSNAQALSSKSQSRGKLVDIKA